MIRTEFFVTSAGRRLNFEAATTQRDELVDLPPSSWTNTFAYLEARLTPSEPTMA